MTRLEASDYIPWNFVEAEPIPVWWASNAEGAPYDHITLPGPVAARSFDAVIHTAQIMAALILEKNT